MACQSTHWADGVWVALAQRRLGTEAKLRATSAGNWICGHTSDKLSPEKLSVSSSTPYSILQRTLAVLPPGQVGRGAKKCFF